MAAIRILQQGIDALKGKQYAAAEDYLIAAYQNFIKQPPGMLDGRWTICCFLGQLYRATGRHNEAITVLENGLPIPGAFKELVSIFRFLGKVAKQEGDSMARAEWYRRMHCVSVLYKLTMETRLVERPLAVDCHEVRRRLDEYTRQYGTIYAYR